MEYCSNSAEETEALGAELAVRLRPGDVVAYTGDLGAGKPAGPFVGRVGGAKAAILQRADGYVPF